MAATKNRETRRLGWSEGLISFLFFAGLVVAASHLTEVERSAAVARHAQPLWLGVAVLLQASTYLWVALGWREVLRKTAQPPPLPRLVRTALVKLFADQVVPGAGMGGNVLLISRLRVLGVSKGNAAATLLISMVGYYLAFAVCALAMLITLWLHRQATPLLVGMVTAFLLIAAAIPTLALWLRARGSAPLPDWVEGFRPLRAMLETIGQAPASLLSDRPLVARVALINGLIFLADAATLTTCLLALGAGFRPATAFVALIAAAIAAVLAPLPMGLGSFEATAVATLRTLGIPLTIAIAATLLLRTLTLWIPLLPGFLLLRRKRRIVQ